MNRVLVIGTGLIGGSIGLALRESGVARVTGFDASSAAAARALELGAVQEIADDLAEAVRGADIVVVATPVGQIVPVIDEVARDARDGTIVTDTGSTKAGIVTAAERSLGPSRPFVGGHPMAGSEHVGVDGARADLFREATWILTPTSATVSDAFGRVRALVAATGANVLAVDPDEHDRLVARVSHLPYAIATVLIDDDGDDRLFRAAAGSFRDMTRVAGSNPPVWSDILNANRDAVVREIDAFVTRLGGLRAAIAGDDVHAVDALLERARDARQKLPLKGPRGPRLPLLVEVPVPDRAGVLADITSAVRDAGVNIEDLHVEHEGATGVIQLLVDGEAAANLVVEALSARAFRPRKREP